MKKIDFYFVILLFISFNNLISNVSNAKATEELTENIATSQAKLEIVKLQPKVKELEGEIDGHKINSINISKLSNFLQELIIINIPNLDKIKKYNNEYLQPIHLFKELNISNGLYSYILGGINGERMFSKGTHFLAKGLEKDDHYDYTLIIPDFSYYHPVTGEYLGTAMLKIGTAKIVDRGKISILELGSACSLVKVGTLIMPGNSLNLIQNNIPIVKNLNNLKGCILSIIHHRKFGFKNDVVLINLGAREGVQVGNLFKVSNDSSMIEDRYQNNRRYIVPNSLLKGEILIYDVFEKLSLGIIIKVNKVLNVLDVVTSN